MADTKLSALSAASAAAVANELYINEAGTSKKISITQLITLLQTLGMPRIKELTSQHSISSGTGTKVTGLDMDLEIGTYVFKYTLIIRQATATGDAPQFGINLGNSGVSSKQNFHARWADATTALTGQTGIMDNVGIKTAGFIGGMAHNAYSTTAPNMGTTVGVAATAADIMCIIEGLIVVTTAGRLELWRSSEGANASTTEVGSSLVVIRTA